MTAVGNFDQVVEQCQLALGEFVKRYLEPWQKLRRRNPRQSQWSCRAWMGAGCSDLIIVLVVLPSSRRALEAGQQPSSRVR
jgi:hypothetical protein